MSTGSEAALLDAGEVEDETQFPLFHPLVTQLVDADPRVRSVACWSLGQLAYRPSLRLVGRMLRRDPDAMVRVQAAQCLARLGGPAATQVLLQGLKDEDELVQEVCIMALRSLGDPQAVYPLEEFARRRGEEGELATRAASAVKALRASEEPGTRPDRRRGGVSKKIRRYLEAVHAEPRDGIAHNNLAVAYFHAAEFDLAVRHCRLAKGLGARVQWLWDELSEAGHDPGKGQLSAEDRAFLEDPEAGIRDDAGKSPTGLQLTPEPTRTDLVRRSKRSEHRPPPSRGKKKGEKEGEAIRAYRIADHREVAGPPAEVQEERRSGERDRRRGRRRGKDRRRRSKT